MIKVAIALPVGVSMSVLGQAPVAAEAFPYADLVLHGGALSVLAYAVWHAYKVELPAVRKVLLEDRTRYHESLNSMSDRHERMQKETLDRHERWESDRHQDSTDLREALGTLAVTCASTRKAIAEAPKAV